MYSKKRYDLIFKIINAQTPDLTPKIPRNRMTHGNKDDNMYIFHQQICPDFEGPNLGKNEENQI